METKHHVLIATGIISFISIAVFAAFFGEHFQGSDTSQPVAAPAPGAPTTSKPSSDPTPYERLQRRDTLLRTKYSSSGQHERLIKSMFVKMAQEGYLSGSRPITLRQLDTTSFDGARLSPPDRFEGDFVWVLRIHGDETHPPVSVLMATFDHNAFSSEIAALVAKEFHRVSMGGIGADQLIRAMTSAEEAYAIEKRSAPDPYMGWEAFSGLSDKDGAHQYAMDIMVRESPPEKYVTPNGRCLVVVTFVPVPENDAGFELAQVDIPFSMTRHAKRRP